VLAAACGKSTNWADYQDKCAAPRSGVDPFTGQAYPDKLGSSNDEKNFLKYWTNDLYLWYREVPDSNPSDYSTPVAYFAVLKTPLKTPSGNLKDRFHFTYDTAFWENLSQSGVEAGYGMQVVLISASPPRSVVVAYNEPNSPAAQNNIDRGAQIVSVDGAQVVNGDPNVLNAGLFPSAAGQPHSFGVIDRGSTTQRTVTMTSANVTNVPVQKVQTITTASGPVGYMLFNDHLSQAEKGLIDAINQLKTAGINDLVVDMRYNGGGLLDVASELAYMVAGGGPTSGKTFEKTVFNDKYPNTDPVIRQPIVPVGFHSSAVGFSATAGTPLPALNLPRVYLLTGSGTCSASESVINGLRGVDVNVYAFGQTTCGKPYGFYPQDNCGTTYFSIEFKGVNQKGFGDYPDGFIPGGAGDTGLPGCTVADDFNHALGDPAEAQLAAALAFRASNNVSCPAGMRRAEEQQVATEVVVPRNVWRENRWYRR
jgi:C-terminal processing protease CtpA/Prc